MKHVNTTGYQGEERRYDGDRRNGDRKFLWGLIAAMFSVIFALAGTWANKVDNQINLIVREVKSIGIDVAILKDRYNIHNK